jgi:hypothetical protein
MDAAAGSSGIGTIIFKHFVTNNTITIDNSIVQYFLAVEITTEFL